MKAILVDMDATLIEAVLSDDPRFKVAPGALIVYQDQKKQTTRLRIHVRPHAISMIRKLVDEGFRYILWSAGVRDYVHAVMNYFSERAGVWPERILTREDMVTEIGSNSTKRYKSMKAIGYDDFLIIDDNPELIIPSERENIIKIRPWSMGEHKDEHLNNVANLLGLYSGRMSVLTRNRTLNKNRMIIVNGE